VDLAAEPGAGATAALRQTARQRLRRRHRLPHRYQTRSTILTSQVPVAQWHEQIGDVTIADGILDRLVHNAHRIELRGESMRKTRAKKPEGKSEA
jgi:hypothetical protein